MLSSHLEALCPHLCHEDVVLSSGIFCTHLWLEDVFLTPGITLYSPSTWRCCPHIWDLFWEPIVADLLQITLFSQLQNDLVQLLPAGITFVKVAMHKMCCHSKINIFWWKLCCWHVFDSALFQNKLTKYWHCTQEKVGECAYWINLLHRRIFG